MQHFYERRDASPHYMPSHSHVQTGRFAEPKTDWDPTKDRLNPESYNRIRNNLAVLGELVNEIYAPLTLESMGEEKNYSSWYYAREFNVFERNLDAINQTSYNKVIGTTKTFLFQYISCFY